MTIKAYTSDILYAYNLIRRGATRKAAAAAINLTPSNLRIRLQGLGLFENMKSARFNRDAAISDYLAGMSCQAVAKKYGVSRNVITGELAKRGVKSRNGSEANYIRFAKMSCEERQSLVASAHKARKGSHDSPITATRKAQARQRDLSQVGPCEDELYNALCSSGFKPIRQKAVDVYNPDFVIGNIAVELTLGTTRYCGLAARESKRLKKLAERGYLIVTITCEDRRAFIDSCNQIVSDLQRICGDPSLCRKHWMIRSYWQRFKTIRLDNGQFSHVKVPENLCYTVKERHIDITGQTVN